jgi:hypothetical protein
MTCSSGSGSEGAGGGGGSGIGGGDTTRGGRGGEVGVERKLDSV